MPHPFAGKPAPWRVLRSTPNQLCLAPAAALAAHVAHYTLTFPAGMQAMPPVLQLLPDISGCLVFQLEPRGAYCVMWGASTRAVAMPVDYEWAAPRFFVEFRPGGAAAITRAPLPELTDRTVPLREADAALRQSLLVLLDEAMAHALPLERLLQEVDALLLGRLAGQPGHRVRPLLGLLAAGGGSSVRALASASGYSERQLQRLFRGGLGVSAKTAGRILRINRALPLVEAGMPLAQVAQEAGYYDQPHFNHDFRAVTGVSPTAYLSTLSVFYKESLKF